MSPTKPAPPIDDLLFPSSHRTVACLTDQRTHVVPAELGGAISYHLPGRSPASGPRIVIGPTGHRTFYGEDGRRAFCTDPSGTLLHECEWIQIAVGTIRLARARVRLDSLLWLGLVAEATTHKTVLDLSRRTDRSPAAPDDLRRMATQAWRVPLDDVRYFFPDSSFEWDADRRVTIRLKKDGLYLLDDGTFAKPRFMSYMGAIPWARIDLLNVVELFQSTLPGTGSAVLELIWGLCDDQRRSEGSIPLRYRGLPIYPSEPAYGLFSSFFRPEVPNGEDPHELFMDTQRANQIAWWPRHDPPWRYFDRTRQLAATVQGGMVQKVMMVDDPVGVPYVAPGTRGGFASCGRTAIVTENRLQLGDGANIRQLTLNPVWGVTHETLSHRMATYPFDWRAFFCGSPPRLDPGSVHTLALFYPDDETEVAELSTQPFVLEQLYVSLNKAGGLPSRLARIRRVLIDGFDAVAAGCIDLDYARQTTVLYRSPEWAQKQAQALWDQAAQTGKLEAVRETRFLPAEQYRQAIHEKTYDLIYCWIPFAMYGQPNRCEEMLAGVSSALGEGGLALIVGPLELGMSFSRWSLHLLNAAGMSALERLPLLTEHLRLHPRTRLNQSLTVFLAEKEANRLKGSGTICAQRVGPDPIPEGVRSPAASVSRRAPDPRQVVPAPSPARV